VVIVGFDSRMKRVAARGERIADVRASLAGNAPVELVPTYQRTRFGGWFVLVVGVAVMAGCTRQPEASPGAAAGGPAMPPPEVTVSQPIVREVTDYFEFPGRTQAVGEVDVRARVTGHIVKVNFHDGQAVRKGDVLFEIDPRPYEAALARAVGDLKRIEALKAKSEADLARAERLRPSGAISIDEYEQQASMVAVHSASIDSAKAAVRDATLNLEFTRIVAPIDGRVSRARITEGNLVQPGGGDDAVLTTVVTVDPIYVYFNIDEPALLKYLELGKKAGGPLHPERIQERKIPVQVGLASEEGFPHTGLLDFMDNKVDATTGTLRARGVFVNANQYFTPGLFVRVRIPYGQAHEALLVNEKALGRDQREKFVLTVNQDNVVEHRLVKVGALHGGFREITAGLQAKDWVVVKGLLRARPGVTVVPQRVSAVWGETAGSSSELVQGAGKPEVKAHN